MRSYKQVEEYRDLIRLLSVPRARAHKNIALVAEYHRLLKDIPDRLWLTAHLANISKRLVVKDVRLILLRGLPGCGKSTLAELLRLVLNIRKDWDVGICETENFLPPPTWGSQELQVAEITEAHRRCQLLTRCFLCQGQIAIVANSNITLGEIAAYCLLAKDCGLTDKQIVVLEPPTAWRFQVPECLQHSSRPPSQEVAEQMLAYLRQYPTNRYLLGMAQQVAVPVLHSSASPFPS